LSVVGTDLRSGGQDALQRLELAFREKLDRLVAQRAGAVIAPRLDAPPDGIAPARPRASRKVSQAGTAPSSAQALRMKAPPEL
jgi:hypothetical protein